jgi:PST family polysaccharide transporter
MTTIGILLSVTELGMIPALVQRADTSEQHYNTAWTVGVVRSLAITGVVFLAAPVIADIFAESRVVNITRALAVLPLIEAAASIKVADLTRHLQFRSLSVAELTRALANTIVSVALAPSLGVWALVAGTLAGPAAYSVMSYILAPHRPQLSLDRHAARPLVRYGRWILLTSLIAISGGAVLRVVISRQLGAAELGLYFLAAKLAFLPSEAASEVFGAVAFPLYARLQANARQVAKAFRAIFTSILVVLTPLFILLIALAPSLVENVLGPRWEGTATLIQILAVIGIIGLVGDAAVPVLKGLGRPYKFAVLEGAQSLLLIAFAWWFTSRFGLIGAGLAWFPAIVGSLLTGVVFLRQHLRRPFAGLGLSSIVIVTASGLGAVVALAIDHLVPGLVGFVLASSLAVIVIGALLWLSDRWFDLGLTSDFARVFPQVAAWVRPSPAEV